MLGWPPPQNPTAAVAAPSPPGHPMHALCTHTLRATDLTAARDWYTRLTGVAPYFDQPFYVGFALGGYELGIQPSTAEVVAGSGTTYWGVDDAQAAVDRALALGATPADPVRDVGEGIQLGAVHDPFGNRLGFVANPHFAVPPVGATVVAAAPAALAAPDGQLAPATLTAQVTVARAPDAVFADWSSSARMSAWLGVPTRIALQIGGPYELHFLADAPAGARGSEGCRVLSFLPGRMLSFTWNAPPHHPETRLRHTWVVLQLDPLPGGATRLSLHHTGWPAAAFGADGQPHPDSPWAETHAYFAAAWPRMLAGYAAHAGALT